MATGALFVRYVEEAIYASSDMFLPNQDLVDLVLFLISLLSLGKASLLWGLRHRLKQSRAEKTRTRIVTGVCGECEWNGCPRLRCRRSPAPRLHAILQAQIRIQVERIDTIVASTGTQHRLTEVNLTSILPIVPRNLAGARLMFATNRETHPEQRRPPTLIAARSARGRLLRTKLQTLQRGTT